MFASGSLDAGSSWPLAPRLSLEPLTSAELDAWFRGGEPEADVCEAFLAWSARARGALDVAIAEGLHALRKGDRLAALGCHLDDYAREVLDVGRSTADALARLGRELSTRPLLREALRAGRVRLRAAQTVLEVAVGEEEARWVERAARCTVRELEAEVERAGATAGEDDERWARLGAPLRPDDRAVMDEADALAAQVMPGAGRVERLEAIAQEFVGTYVTDDGADVARSLGGAVRPLGPREDRRATLEADTERWWVLPTVGDIPAPDLSFDDGAAAADIDRVLRRLAAVRAVWDDHVGYCAHAVRRSQMYRLLGFASFRHYCEERLGLPARTVEQRAAVEARRWASPALQAAKRSGLPFEKLRLLTRLASEAEITAWAERAASMTCIALRRALEGERERQMRGQRRLSVPLPDRVVALLAAAVQAVRDHTGMLLPIGRCLAVVAQHFIDTWQDAVSPCRTRSRKVRERDEGHCQVPGCSRRAAHAHHVLFRSHGGGDELDNQVALCAFHHLRCVHGGYLRVVGRAPDELRWFLNGVPWAGPAMA